MVVFVAIFDSAEDLFGEVGTAREFRLVPEFVVQQEERKINVKAETSQITSVTAPWRRTRQSLNTPEFGCPQICLVA